MERHCRLERECCSINNTLAHCICSFCRWNRNGRRAQGFDDLLPRHPSVANTGARNISNVRRVNIGEMHFQRRRHAHPQNMRATMFVSQLVCQLCQTTGSNCAVISRAGMRQRQPRQFGQREPARRCRMQNNCNVRRTSADQIELTWGRP